MIQFDSVTLSFAGHLLFEDVSFTLQKGEKVGLVGRNGSGKSTLFRLIEGGLESDGGSITVPKDYRIGYLQQHIRFTKPTVLKEASLNLPEEELYKAEKILFGLGFNAEDLSAFPSEFSGGYHLRLHLAKVLIAEPDCLLLDEPTNYLDILSIRWLTNFLCKWQGEFILISHDRDFMDSVTTHTMGIHRQKVRKMKGSTLDFFEQILIEEEVYERTRVKQERRRVHMQRYVERFGAKASKASQAQSRKKMMAREPALEKLNRLAHLSFNFLEAPFPGKKMLKANHLYFSFAEDPLIEDFSLEIEKGQRIAVIGKNGRGKSTILRLLAGDLNPDRGSMKVFANTEMGYFGQTHINRLNEQLTITEEIARSNPELKLKEIKQIAGLMMFGGSLSDKKISVLSGGEKSRVLIGKIIAKPCNLLLLDEPTHHLDIESIESLIDALEDFAGTIVIVTHSELILRRLALDKIIVCKERKQIQFQGNYDEFLEKVGFEEPVRKPKKRKIKPTAQRSAVLKPIEREIQKCEKRITDLENEQKKSQDVLETGKFTDEELKAIGLRQKKLENLEEELLRLYEHYEKKKGEFL